MAQIVEHIIDPDGNGDYTTLNAWEAAQQRDLTTADEIASARCISTGGSADTSIIDIYGWTTSSTQYIRIYVPEEHRHRGTWDSTKYRNTNGGNNVFDIGEDYTVLSGLQIQQSNTGGTPYDVIASSHSNGDNALIENCIIDVTGDDANDGIVLAQAFEWTINNTIIYCTTTSSSNATGIKLSLAAATLNINNCVIYNFYYGILGTNFSGGTVNIYNTVSFNNYDDISNSGVTVNTYNCATDDGDGTNPVTAPTWSDVFVAHTTYDFRLKAAAALINAGTTTNLPLTDAVGVERVHWHLDKVRSDIGALHFVAPIDEKIVDTDGTGDYTSLSAWEAGEQNDQTSNGYRNRVRCMATDGTADTTSFTLTGWTNTIECGVEIIADVDDKAGTNWDTSKYRLEETQTSGQIVFDVNEAHVVIDGLQIKMNTQNYASSVVYIRYGDCVVRNCLIEVEHSSTGAGNGYGIYSLHSFEDKTYIYNNVVRIHGAGNGTMTSRGMYLRALDTGSEPYFYVYNNTVYSNYNSSEDRLIWDREGGTVVAKNNIALGAGTSTDCWYGTFHTDSDYNLASNLDVVGTNSTAIIVAADVFTNPANGDLSLDPSDTDAFMAGINLAADEGLPIRYDINNNPRIYRHWDMGAEHYKGVEDIVTVDPGGTGDYTTLNAAEAGEQGDYTTAEIVKVYEVKTTNGNADTTAMTFDGSTCDYKHHIIVRPAEGWRHKGVWDDNLYRLSVADRAILIDDRYTHIDGIQIEMDNGYYDQCICIDPDQDASNQYGAVIKNCIIKANSNATRAGLRGIYTVNYFDINYIYNNIIYGFNSSTASVGIMAAESNSIIANNTIYDCYDGIRGGASRQRTVYNNLIFNCDNDCISATPYIEDYNYVDDTTTTGSNSLNSYEPLVRDSVNDIFLLHEMDFIARRGGLDLRKGIAGSTYGDLTQVFWIDKDIKGNDRTTINSVGADAFSVYEDVSIIDPDGTGDYSTLSAWESGEQGNLIDQYKIAKAECISSDGTADTTAVTISGWITSSKFKIKIGTYGENRHNGVLDENKYRIRSYSSCITSFLNPASHVELHGLQIILLDTSSDRHGVNTYNCSDWVVSDCIICDLGTGTSNRYGIYNRAGDNYYIYNNIIYGFSTYGIYSSTTTSGTAIIYNNTVVDCGVGIYTDSLDVVAKNNIVQDCTTCYSGTFNSDSDYNLADDTTAPGSNSVQSTSLTFNDASGDDYHLNSSDSSAIHEGVNLIYDEYIPITHDIDGDRIKGLPCIGADYYVTSGSVETIYFNSTVNGAMSLANTLQVVKNITSTINGSFTQTFTVTFVDVVLEAIINATVANSSSLPVDRDISGSTSNTFTISDLNTLVSRLITSDINTSVTNEVTSTINRLLGGSSSITFSLSNSVNVSKDIASVINVASEISAVNLFISRLIGSNIDAQTTIDDLLLAVSKSISSNIDGTFTFDSSVLVGYLVSATVNAVTSLSDVNTLITRVLASDIDVNTITAAQLFTGVIIGSVINISTTISDLNTLISRSIASSIDSEFGLDVNAVISRLVSSNVNTDIDIQDIDTEISRILASTIETDFSFDDVVLRVERAISSVISGFTLSEAQVSTLGVILDAVIDISTSFSNSNFDRVINIAGISNTTTSTITTSIVSRAISGEIDIEILCSLTTLLTDIIFSNAFTFNSRVQILELLTSMVTATEILNSSTVEDN